MIDFKQLHQNDFQLLHEWFKDPTIIFYMRKAKHGQ